MDNINNTILKILSEKKMLYIATMGEHYVDNAMITYCNEGFDLYFGSFSDTLKCRNISKNPVVAICIDTLQIHGKAELIEYGSEDYFKYREQYLEKFPHYRFYFELQKNELYRVQPLVIWHYDSSKRIMHRDSVIFDPDYYRKLMPYESPEEFKKR